VLLGKFWRRVGRRGRSTGFFLKKKNCQTFFQTLV
jgi:hypothetical protein